MAELDLFVVEDVDVQNAIVDYVTQNLNETLYPGDERKIYMEVLTSYLVGFLVTLNEKFNQRFAKYAKGKILDEHGINEGCERLTSTPSKTIEKFSIAMPLDINVIIPQGTRVTGDNQKYFATENIAVIYAGETFVEVPVIATEGGASYNGYGIGQLNKLVDKVEYISSVTNLEETAGGDDGEPYPEEDGGIGDEHYYERIKLSKNSKSTAGAEDLYIYYAKSADPSITAVYPTSPSPGVVDLAIACQNGEIPSDEILNKVLEACSPKAVRPLGDKLTVSKISQVSYDIELTYYTTQEEENDVVKEVEGENGAIERYNSWQSSEIGRAINPDRLRSEILKSDKKPVGADFVEIVKPVFTKLTSGQVAKWSGKMTVNHKTTLPEA